MPNALSKVHKKINKKKGKSNGLHENSRDAQKLRRAGARLEKLDKLRVARSKANESYCAHYVELFRVNVALLTMCSG